MSPKADSPSLGEGLGETTTDSRDGSVEAVVDRRRHFRSTVALCSTVFLVFYVSVSVFPYLGFMILHLVPGLHKNNVGVHVGFLAGAFMMGRTMTSFAWGRVADIYGRKFVLVVTLIISSVGSTCIAFGYSTSYAMAMIVRFLIGAGNGTMIVAFTAITELAKGDKELETKGVGMVMSMVGYGMLVCPAIGGFLAEPLQQYPNFDILNGALDPLLIRFPFIIPNLLGALLSLLSLVTVVAFVEETLPVEKRRDWKHIGSDLLAWIGSFKDCCSSASSQCAVSQGGDPEIANERTPLTQPKEQSDRKGVSFATILSQPDTRAFLIAGWFNHLASISQTEALPLFAMALVGGLGMNEKEIGLVGALAGLFYCMGQYMIFKATMKRFGVVRAMQYGALFGAIPMILFPFALFFQGFAQIVFLSVVTSATSISRSIAFGSVTIGCNRTVDASKRAATNGVSGMMSGWARGVGPILTGWLMAFCLSSGVVPPKLGAWAAYSVLAVVGFVAYWSTLLVPNETSQ